MASFDYRLNPLYKIEECSSCGALYNKGYCCSIWDSFCGNGAHYGYDCPPQVPFVYNPEPCYDQNYDEFPQTSPSLPQQYPCCEDCGGPHMTYECQPMNYYKPDPCYDSNYSGFDQIEPLQYSIDRQPQIINQEWISDLNKGIIESLQSMFEEFRERQQAANINQSPPREMSIREIEDLKQHCLDEMQSITNQISIENYKNVKIDFHYRRDFEIRIDELKEKLNEMSIEIRKKEKEQLEQLANLSNYPS
ncbi:hypothetical protein Tco_1255256 [Tanacetum coccineum]